MVRSYTTDGKSLLGILPTAVRQFQSLRDQKRRLPEIVRSAIASMERFRQSAESLTGLNLVNLDVLEIGHGQSQFALAYMASLPNTVTGIDLDVIPDGLFDVAGYVRTIRANGFLRAAKTFLRDASGLNAAQKREFLRQIGRRTWPECKALVADAADTGFKDRSFDFIFSFHVLEHVADPEAVLREVGRLLRPGGGFWFRFPHYAHYNALHDLRWITQAANPPRPWAHLIDSERETVHQGAFVNTLRIDEWRRIFERNFPGTVCLLEKLDGERFAIELRAMRSRGYLDEFSDEELLTDDLICAWRKP